eukprot:2358474-Rhodomonas_salina.8
MSGTELAYAATRPLLSTYRPSYRQQAEQVGSPISLRACYAMSGTDIAYGTIPAMRCPVQTYRTMVSPYALATRYPVLS